jgi:hypothetical protein
MRVLLLTALVFLALVATGQAHYQLDEHNWWFGASTYGEADDASGRVDPLNLLFYPGWFGEDEINRHFNHHVNGPPPPREPAEFIEHDNMTTIPGFCRGTQWIQYRRLAPPPDAFEWAETDLQAALVDNSDADCANRYHIRMWGDAFHEQLTQTRHDQDEAWIVAGAHYEELAPTHEPRLDWDTVEHRIARWMRPHYFHMRWRCLPGSYGFHQRFHNDGRITRISINEGEGDRTPATRENGQC